MQHAVEIKPLTKDIVRENIATLIEISKQFENDYWELDHYLSDYNRKWELSYVAFINNNICGFNIVSEKAESLHIHRIVISKEYQNYGIGRLFMEQTIVDARKIGKEAITLKVEKPTENTLKFYRKFNFEITGKRGEMLSMELKIAP
jgi:ribosomal protein S18 acetylase RimI-like enzyme